MTSRSSLRGASVLVTRPEGQAEALCRGIEAAGGVPVRLPLIEIEAVEPDDSLTGRLAAMDQFDVAIFVSPNAVEHGMTLLERAGGSLSAAAVIAAVGKASAAALEKRGISRVVFPSAASNSEELLKCDELQRVEGRRVLIFRGQDGRELLADGLRARGAAVEYACVYRRVAPRRDLVAALDRWLDADRPVLVLTSGAAAAVLLERTEGALRDRLLDVPLAVLGARLRDICRKAGWRGPIGVCDAGDDALVRTVVELIRSQPESSSR